MYTSSRSCDLNACERNVKNVNLVKVDFLFNTENNAVLHFYVVAKFKPFFFFELQKSFQIKMCMDRI